VTILRPATQFHAELEVIHRHRRTLSGDGTGETINESSNRIPPIPRQFDAENFIQLYDWQSGIEAIAAVAKPGDVRRFAATLVADLAD